MFSTIKELFLLLTPKQKKNIFKLQLLIVVMAFAEIVGIVSIGPFMMLVGDMSKLESGGKLTFLYQLSGATTPESFMFLLGCVVILLLVVGGGLSMYTTWRLLTFSQTIGMDISARLYRHYLHQPWLFHANESSSKLTKQVSQEASRTSSGIIQPLMLMNAKIVLSTMMVLTIFLYNPMVASAGVLLFVCSYFLLYRTIRSRLVKNSKVITDVNIKRYQLMAEGFGGVKDLLILNRQQPLINAFSKACTQFAKGNATNQAMAQVPRYAMELIAFGSIMLLILYLLQVNQGDLSSVLPVLAVFAFAGFKLLPAFQQIYASIATIKGSLQAFETIKVDLKNSYKQAIDAESGRGNTKVEALKVDAAIELSNVYFAYPGKDKPAVDNLSLFIPAKKVIGLVGASGSGKSTTIDILLGLLAPQSGSFCVDGVEINESNRQAWQSALGFVPQSIFLADASIKANIAFGVEDADIDENAVLAAAKMAHLEDIIAALPEGIDTKVGERGVQLSGGQRQRIGIARALYSDAKVLILDEATSALDGITEKLVMDAIHDFSGKKTIIMIAHRLSTVKQCDEIFLMSEGKIIDQGTYEHLIANNDDFKKMAALS